jgi:hypothetical protein
VADSGGGSACWGALGGCEDSGRVEGAVARRRYDYVEGWEVRAACSERG